MFITMTHKTLKNRRFFVSRKFEKFSRKSEAGLVIILVLIIVLFFFGWLINFSQRECKSNKDCGSESYCGSDFSCHQYPTIQKTVVQYNFIVPSIIIGIAILIASIIFKYSATRKTEDTEPIAQETKINNIEAIKVPEEVEDITEPYYKSDSNVRTP